MSIKCPQCEVLLYCPCQRCAEKINPENSKTYVIDKHTFKCSECGFTGVEEHYDWDMK